MPNYLTRRYTHLIFSAPDGRRYILLCSEVPLITCCGCLIEGRLLANRRTATHRHFDVMAESAVWRWHDLHLPNDFDLGSEPFSHEIDA